MKKFFVAFAVFLFFTPAAVYAAEYLVQGGDTLTNIAKFTGHSIKELQVMNPILANPNKIQVGQRLRWVSNTDREFAASYCMEMRTAPDSSGEEKYFYAQEHERLLKGVAYTGNPNEMSFEKVFAYVDAYKVVLDQQAASHRKLMALISRQ